MYRPTPTPQQVLSHSEVPGFSGLFVLGFQERHVNLYSQQVRALNLVLALELDKRLTLIGRRKLDEDCVKVCVVGGGASGAMAAVAFALCGCKVTIFESRERLLPLPDPELSGAEAKNQRTIHPHLMHWPYVTGQHDEAGLPFMSWTAGEIGKVLNEIKNGFDDIKEKRKLTIEEKCSTQVHAIGRQKLDVENTWHPSYTVHYFECSGRNEIKSTSQEFDLVILATGFGAEKSYPGLPFDSYWKNDWLSELQSREGSVLVSGIGDGGIEDAIQLALAKVIPVHELVPFLFDRPDESGESIPEDLRTSVRALKSWLTDIEERAHGVDPSKQSYFLKTKWDEGYDEPEKYGLKKAFEKLDETLKGKRKTAPIEITLNASGTSFHSLRSSVVHRLILYCLEKIGEKAKSGPQIKYVQGQLVADVSQAKTRRYAIQSKNKLSYLESELLIVRHGPKLYFENLKFEPENMRAAIRELRTRNVLDQTRFPMWPIYGNPKRFTRFAQLEGKETLDVKRYDPLADKPTELGAMGDVGNVLPELVVKLAPRPRKLKAKETESKKFGEIEFVYVPGGRYLLGRDKTSNPLHVVELKGFWISRYPITVKQYVEFVEHYYHEWPVQLRDIDVRGRLESAALRRGKVPTIASKDLDGNREEFIKERLEHPITDISWVDAMHYCQWAGFSLPTAAQWEAACTGHLENLSTEHSPHNKGFSYEYIHFRRTGKMTGTSPVNTFAIARSPFGVVQQLGNIWEFLLDSWDENPKCDTPDPVNFNDSRQREFRGGSWFDYDHPSAFERGHNGDRNRNGRDGFRVVWVNPNDAGTLEQDQDATIQNRERPLEFPKIDEKADWETCIGSNAKYIGTPALRRLYVVHLRKMATYRPKYLTFGQLREAFEHAAVDIVLGWHNTDPNTDQRFSALSCDSWYLSQLTEVLLSRGAIRGELHTRLAQEVQDKLTVGEGEPRILSCYPRAIVAIGSGSVNAVTQALVDYDIVPGFEQSANSTIFGKDHFFANPEDAVEYGVLVAFNEKVGEKDQLRLLIAGRSGFASAAAIAFITKQLRKETIGTDSKMPSEESTLAQLADDIPVRVVFRVKRKDFGSESRFQHWQDAGIPDMSTFTLVEPPSSHVM